MAPNTQEKFPEIFTSSGSGQFPGPASHRSPWAARLNPGPLDSGLPRVDLIPEFPLEPQAGPDQKSSLERKRRKRESKENTPWLSEFPGLRINLAPGKSS